MVTIKWTRDALDDLEKIDEIIVRRVLEKVSWLEKNFEHIVPEKLRHDLKNLYKLRVGDYRAIYSLKPEMIVIQAVQHRSKVYRK